MGPRIIPVALALALLAGCVAPVRVTSVNGPNGKPAYVLRCGHEEYCYGKAGELCPAGYQLLNTTSGTVIASMPNGIAGAPRHGLLIECK